MGKVDVLKETTPLSSEDCFLVMQRPKSFTISATTL